MRNGDWNQTYRGVVGGERFGTTLVGKIAIAGIAFALIRLTQIVGAYLVALIQGVWQ